MRFFTANREGGRRGYFDVSLRSLTKCKLFSQIAAPKPKNARRKTHLMANKHRRMAVLIKRAIVGYQEHTMIEFILEKIGSVIESSERHRREAFLATSVGLADLERRLRFLEAHGYPPHYEYRR